MRIVSSVTAMQASAKRLRQRKALIAFVPTMGYLHAGHMSLVERARKIAGKAGVVVVSIYVNPTQFAPHEDLSKYPRDLERDKALCRKAGVDILFVPSNDEMYPEGYSTYVSEEKLSGGMEGASRPTHFRGVTTIVAKLFNIVLPDAAVFGAKDFQQAAIVRKMVGDLNFPLKIVVSPTVRESDGLAMSSRNRYLTPAQREQATILWKCLEQARALAGKKRIAAERMKATIRDLVATQPEARLDYVEFFDPSTLCPATVVERGTQMALAVFVGKTRLIDNAQL